MDEDRTDSPARGNVNRRSIWDIFGRRVPRNEIVFFCQMILIYVVVGVSLFNLSRGHGTDNLWVALLGSCLGYVLPNPSIESFDLPATGRP